MSQSLHFMESSSYILKNLRLIDPALKLDRQGHVFIENGVLSAILDDEALKTFDGTKTDAYDLSGLVLVPGFIDLRTRFGEPGFEDRETVESGLNAAAAGGFVAVCVSPECDPVTDQQAHVEFLLNRAEDHAVSLLPLGAVTRGLMGERLADMGELARAGVVGFSDGNRGLQTAAALRGALSYARMFNLPIFEKATETSLMGGQVHEGVASLKMGLKGLPRLAEDIAVYRSIRVAEYEATDLHLQLLSTTESLQILQTARDRGVAVTADCSPQHLALCDEDQLDFDATKRMDPPLRPRADREALREACASGLIQAICSDHQPSDFDGMDREYTYTPFGCASLETAFCVAYESLVDTGILDLNALLALFSSGPREILGLPECRLEVGAPAEFTFLNLSEEWTFETKHSHSLSHNSPWNQKAFKTRPAGVLNGRFLALSE
jgi:dihydroorotase